jgi:hypothetical protein
MSTDLAPKITRKMDLGFAVETTTGTPATISGTNAITRVFNLKMKPNVDVVNREPQGISLSQMQQSLGARAGTCTFETELVGGGSSGSSASWLPLMQACATVLTGSVLTPQTSNITTLTLAQWIDGRRYMMSGCQGNPVITMRRGEKARVAWTFRGVWQPPADVSQPTPTYVTLPPPRAGASFSFDSLALRVAEIVFDFGNQVVMREDAGGVDSAGTATGYRNAYITARKPTFKFSPESLPLATFDPNALNETFAQSAFSLQIGTSANNQFTIAAPKLQIVEHPEQGDRQGLFVDDIMCWAERNSSAGEDEWSITLG